MSEKGKPFGIVFDWRKVGEAYNLMVSEFGCIKCKWSNSLMVTLLSVGDKVYAVHLLDLKGKVSPQFEFPPHLLLVDIGKVETESEVSFPVNAMFTPRGFGYEFHFDREVSPEEFTYINEIGVTKDLPSLGEFPRFKLRDYLVRVVPPFGDCYFFSTEVDGKVYSLITDLYRVLLFDWSPTDGEITYLPVISSFVKRWKYDVLVGENCYFVEVTDGIYVCFKRRSDNPIPKILKFWESLHDKYLNVTLPLKIYKKYVEKTMKSLGRGTLEVMTEGGNLTFTFYLSSETSSYSYYGDLKIPVDEVTPRAGVQIPQPETLNWDKILGVKRKWYDFLPFTKRNLQISIPYNWKPEEGKEVKIPPFIVRLKGRKYPLLALYPTGLFYTTED
ncbi:MAG: hypothetical protein QXV20_02075 [Candidatus Hadarchaeales archaeon]